MEDHEAERLQERLERLESGTPVERCLTDLPEEEQLLLKLAARLRQLVWPVRDRERVAAQRAALMQHVTQRAQQGVEMQHSSVSGSGNGSRRWLVPAVFAGVVGIVLFCIALTALGGGWLWWQGRSGQAVKQVGGDAKPTPSYTLWLPAITYSLPATPARARVEGLHGVVEVQRDGVWGPVVEEGIVESGQRVRTGALSGATFRLFDGSVISLEADAELAFDQLDARTGDGPRVVQLTQVAGASRHQVARATVANSRYEVHAASATGAAKGTVFGVAIDPEGRARYEVDEGTVAVTGAGQTVSVDAGQLTIVPEDDIPAPPAFRISGEGTVEAIGSTWTIAGQVFQTYTGTTVIGDPQVGDWVAVEGSLRSDNTRVADLIMLLRRSSANRFTLTGEVEARSGSVWTVAGQAITVTDQTAILGEIAVGDAVRVEGVITAGGGLQAQRIERLSEPLGLPFDFTGVVQTRGADLWIVSDVTLRIVTNTQIAGGLEVGDIVRATGWILPDGTWEARSLTPALPEDRIFELTGPIVSLAPWDVAGLTFEIREWTEIAAGLAIGDLVRVRGRILEDGTRVAFSIERLATDESIVVLIGTVQSRDPWVVSGVPLRIISGTVIIGEIPVGTLVRVEARVRPDGQWEALRIEPYTTLGCLTLNAVVIGVSRDQLQIIDWPALALGEDTQIVGDLRPRSVVQLRICFAANRMYLVSIIVIDGPPPVVTPPGGGQPGGSGGETTICHKPGKNQHTMSVPQSALQGHLGHGDTLGPCP